MIERPRRDASDYVIGPDTEITEIDLEAEEFIYRGERLTEERAERIAEETLAEIRRRNLIPGRKSLTGGQTHSPRVQFRAPAPLYEEAVRRAEQEGRSLSDLARDALERYLAS